MKLSGVENLEAAEKRINAQITPQAAVGVTLA